MSTLHLTVGLPGCGKSTTARAWVAEAPQWRARVNRDELRAVLHGTSVHGARWQEDQITAAQHAAAAALLASGVDVVVDDTNLHPEHRDALAALAQTQGADVSTWDMTDVPLDVCLARNAFRPAAEQVPEDVVRKMAATLEREQAPRPVSILHDHPTDPDGDDTPPATPGAAAMPA